MTVVPGQPPIDRITLRLTNTLATSKKLKLKPGRIGKPKRKH
jgi:hypothetical protein